MSTPSLFERNPGSEPQPQGEHTEVAVRIHARRTTEPPPPAWTEHPLAQTLQFAVATGLAVLLITYPLLLALVVVSVLVIAGGLHLSGAIAARRRARAIAAWGEDRRRALWIALEARLDPPKIYR